MSRKTLTESEAVRLPFDARRALLVRWDIFPPLHVKAVRPLREAVARGDLREDALLLVAVRGAATLALPVRQLMYHHVAQGELAGEPWMVSF
jgi:hypothetical protein